ncbi:MAG: peptidylprolyl isomerase [Flavobacteriales bacterium CG_4_10_14_0_2_um_filter_32_8]|nr:MAG: peptidylprolyl isomerase [Flavobacteriales bacterium CG_4_10_14_0_2_um_filter_32_8]PJB13835.1 MAG: peptidylprolyl isomerase [Flavobacteriales bacterium CG_4_9_14_3_um_filter_32_8]
MKKQLFNILLLAIFITASNGYANAQKDKKKDKKEETAVTKIELKNMVDSVSYAIGLNMATSIKKDFSEANFEAFIEGLKSGVKGEGNLIAMEKIQEIVGPYFQKKQETAQAEELKKSESVKTDGIKFLEENKNKEGVVTTASGLQYLVLKEGTGKQPTATSSVTVHYHGTTTDGTVFDSSVDRGQPATFGLNQVIAGWTEGVALMKEGAKFRFFIPQELAYGATPRPGGPIKPYMTLIFEVELISVND